MSTVFFVHKIARNLPNALLDTPATILSLLGCSASLTCVRRSYMMTASQNIEYKQNTEYKTKWLASRNWNGLGASPV
jgi:hypothetical protein